MHQRILDACFTRGWQFLATDDRLPAAGQVNPVTLLPGSLDVPLILTRETSENLHCLSNVCTHRGAIICTRRQHCEELRCPYHSRRFRLDGRMRYAPGFRDAERFPDEHSDLPALPLASLGPLWFTSLEREPTLDEWLQPVLERIGWLPLGEFQFSEQRSRTYEFDANWMLYVENYLDSLHIPFVHSGLNKTLDFNRYTTECFANGSLQLAIAATDETAFDPPASTPDHGRRVAAWYFWLFPNLMLNFYPWGLSLNLVEPQGVARTSVRFMTLIWREQLLDSGAGAALHTVEMEDEAMVLSVQRGLASRLYRRGRYAPEHEAACHHFHRLVLACLEASAEAN